MRAALVFGLLLLCACGSGRHLSPGEQAFATHLFGDGLNPRYVRVSRISGGTTPPPGEVDAGDRAPPVVVDDIRTEAGLCDRTAPDTGPRKAPPAFALYNQVNVSPEFYRDDMMPGWPERFLVPEGLIVAHELVHVWQWQNRHRTGYRPVRAAVESVLNRDPYFYSPEDEPQFLDYGFEQQAALIEDYMCYALYDPDNPRRVELRRILSPHFTIDRLDAALRR